MSNATLRESMKQLVTSPALIVPENYGFTRSNPDSDDPTLFTRVVYLRRNGTRILQADLQNKVDGKYLREVVKYFEDDGATIRDEITWEYSYEGDVIKSKIAVPNTP